MGRDEDNAKTLSIGESVDRDVHRGRLKVEFELKLSRSLTGLKNSLEKLTATPEPIIPGMMQVRKDFWESFRRNGLVNSR